MKANELRIGNLITDETNDIYVVLGLFGSEDSALSVSTYQEENVIKYQNHEFNMVQGIPLTEEWLKKLGFDKRENPNNTKKSVFWDNGEVKLILSDKLYCSDIVQTIELKHVHQLQNLYFALTNQELIYTK